jgi:hypothetical protein
MWPDEIRLDLFPKHPRRNWLRYDLDIHHPLFKPDPILREDKASFKAWRWHVDALRHPGGAELGLSYEDFDEKVPSSLASRLSLDGPSSSDGLAPHAQPKSLRTAQPEPFFPHGRPDLVALSASILTSSPTPLATRPPAKTVSSAALPPEPRLPPSPLPPASTASVPPLPPASTASVPPPPPPRPLPPAPSSTRSRPLSLQQPSAPPGPSPSSKAQALSPVSTVTALLPCTTFALTLPFDFTDLPLVTASPQRGLQVLSLN